jgi:hypothetical protein
VNQAVERALVDRLITLAGQAANPAVRAVASASLRQLRTRTQNASSAHEQLIAGDIERFLERPMDAVRPIAPPAPPPGAPIGLLGPEW